MVLRRTMVPRAAILATLLAGCGAPEEPQPVACRDGADAYAAALRSAPATVRLDATTTLTQCIRRSKTDAELVTLGATLTAVGERLSLRAAAGDRAAALQLGYLAGAAERAARDTEGIHAELAYRLERSAAAVSDTPGGVGAAVRRGLRAGSATT